MVFSANETCSEPFEELVEKGLLLGLTPIDILGHIVPTEFKITADGIKAFEEFDRANKAEKRSNIAVFISLGAVIVSIIGVIIEACI